MSIKGSDPVFPINERNDDGTHHHSHLGIPLRAWLIGQALSGKASVELQSYPEVTATVRSACALADAALAEINKETT
jgi:hypothetical protein